MTACSWSVFLYHVSEQTLVRNVRRSVINHEGVQSVCGWLRSLLSVKLYLISAETCTLFSPGVPVSYIGKIVGSCASVKESMRTAVRFPMAADFRDLNFGLARSFARDLKWRGVHSNGWAVVKDLARTGSRPNDRCLKPEYLFTFSWKCLLFGYELLAIWHGILEGQGLWFSDALVDATPLSEVTRRSD